jgi:hypothetical protein
VGKPEEEVEVKLSNKAYDQAKFVALIALPAIGTLYFAVAAVWGLPKADEVVGTIVAVDAFLGALLGLSSSTYNNSDNMGGRYAGDLVVHRQDGVAGLLVNLNTAPENLTRQTAVSFKVVDATKNDTSFMNQHGNPDLEV